MNNHELEETSKFEKAPEERRKDLPTSVPSSQASSDGSSFDLTSLKTLSEVAQMLRKSPGQVRRLFDEGKIPNPIYVGRTPMWPQQLIQDWVRAQVLKGGR